MDIGAAVIVDAGSSALDAVRMVCARVQLLRTARVHMVKNPICIRT
jgi:hypothetical protein